MNTISTPTNTHELPSLINWLKGQGYEPDVELLRAGQNPLWIVTTAEICAETVRENANYRKPQ